MKSKELMISSETAEQEAVVEYCTLKHIPIVHIPNEGKRSKSYGAQLRRLGLQSGFPDLFIPMACGGAFGLFIEMKYGKGKVSKDQERWLCELDKQGYRVAVCYGAENAVRNIECYVRMSRTTGG